MIVYGSGHETPAVLLPGFANKTAAVSWPDPYNDDIAWVSVVSQITGMDCLSQNHLG